MGQPQDAEKLLHAWDEADWSLSLKRTKGHWKMIILTENILIWKCRSLYCIYCNLCSHLLCPDFLCPMARRLASMTGTAMRPQLSPAITVLSFENQHQKHKNWIELMVFNKNTSILPSFFSHRKTFATGTGWIQGQAAKSIRSCERQSCKCFEMLCPSAMTKCHFRLSRYSELHSSYWIIHIN